MSILVPMAVPLTVISLLKGKSWMFPLTPMIIVPSFFVRLTAALT
jgi:hypothetical protein